MGFGMKEYNFHSIKQSTFYEVVQEFQKVHIFCKDPSYCSLKTTYSYHGLDL